MGTLQFQTKFMAVVLITFLLMAALEVPSVLRSCGPGKALGIAFDSRSTRSRKINAGTESHFQHASVDSDKREKLVGIYINLRDRARSLVAKRRVPSPPPAPTRNRQKITLKPLATPPSMHHRR